MAPQVDSDNTPVIILVKPQLGQNIGTAARAMYNGALTQLRLVQPKGGWPNIHAIKPAAGAHVILDNVQVFESTREAIADLNLVFGTTARIRDMNKYVLTPQKLAEKMQSLTQEGSRVGVLFGPERTGLDNEDMSLVDGLIHVPLNPDYSSLNLAQAVLLIAYEWFKIQHDTEPERLKKDDSPFATKEELLGFFEHLERELDASGFLRVLDKRPVMVRNIRNMFLRSAFTAQEVRTLRGIVSSLAHPYHSRKENKE
ncbi:MAG: RNA methyltransferase [Pseudomonadota bacterium]